MRTAFFLSSLFVFLFPSAPLQTSKDNRHSEAGWTGSISYVYTQTSHHAGPYSDFIYKKWDHFYEQRMDAVCTNNKGLATSGIQLTDTSYYREKTGSRIVEQWENTRGTAQGKDSTEAAIYIDQEHKTYTIEVPIPETTGNKIKTFICKGCGQPAADPITSSLGEEATMIVVENEKLGSNPNVLSGEKTEHKKIDNGEGEEITITRWKFTKGK